MAEVDSELALDVQWQPFSLSVLNEGNEPGNHEVWHARGHMLGKLLMTVQKELGNKDVAALYTLLGTKLHNEKRDDFDAVVKESLHEAGIDQGLLDKSDNHATDDALRANTAHGIKLVGPDVGVPIVAIDEKAFFGPVISPAPKGEDAINLWKSVSLAIATPGFYELKRGRTVGPDFS